MIVFLFTIAKIYITIVYHNEEPNHPPEDDYTVNRDYYLRVREGVRKFSLMLKENGVDGFDWQSDWCFLQGCLKWEDNGVKENTNGKNIVRWLYEDMNFEVDPHAHETDYNYADVAYLIDSCGVEPTHVAGGFIFYPVEESVFDHFLNPIHGEHYEYTWTPEILWGASEKYHRGHDDSCSGIWKPLSKDNFYIHNHSGPVVYVGGYKREFQGLWELLGKQENGELEEGMIYTTSIFVGQTEVTDDEFISYFDNQIKALKPYEEEGRIEWIKLEEVVEIWKTQYDSVPSIFPPQGIEEERKGLIQKKTFVGKLIVHSKKNKEVVFILLSSDGRVLGKERVSLKEGKNIIDFDDLRRGVFFIKDRDDPGITYKLIKLN